MKRYHGDYIDDPMLHNTLSSSYQDIMVVVEHAILLPIPKRHVQDSETNSETNNTHNHVLGTGTREQA